ncbi:LysR substrate-binding domain-containing protein [Brevundimonas sp. LF-1]|uniref:LysR substrate-binding domain-containing protein n=1 Tax=Brevundimonas sp. LF-1 TaxID=3126100 RepID=UPI0030E58EB7
MSISVPPSFAAKWLAPRIARFSAAHPEIEVWMSADMRLADVSGGRVDVAVRYGRGDYAGVRSEHLLNADVTPVCSPILLAGSRPLRKATDLAQHVLIHLRPSELEEPRPDWGPG